MKKCKAQSAERKEKRAWFCFLRYALCALLFALIIPGCTENNRMYKESRVLMDTYCTITVVSPEKEAARGAIEAGFAEIQKLDLLLNYFSDDSEISAINRAAGNHPVKVSRETLDMMKKTLYISEMTNGVFDPTIAPVVSLWNFSKDMSNPLVPSKNIIASTVKLVDYEKVKIDSDKLEVFLEDNDMELDLGGIAKGYAADRAVEAIKARGIKAALVAVAGDIRGFGLNTSGNAWKVGIQNPRPDSLSDKPWEDIIASLHLGNMAISTSGDYQRFFIKDGKRFHHILDPETGFPAESDLVSVSVIAPEGYLSDSLSTTVFALGLERGLSFLESSGLDGVLINAEKKVFVTKNLKGKLEMLNNEYRLAE
ncbi:MAG: FAD:protein FMN transferase [Nitrospirota bacterium]